MDAASLTIDTNKGERRAVPWGSISRLEVQTGTRKPYVETMLVGAAIGGLIGLVVPLDDQCGSPEKTSYSLCSRGEMVGAIALSFAALSLIGAASVSQPKWARVRPPYGPSPRSAHLDIRMGPTRRGGAGQVVLTF